MAVLIAISWICSRQDRPLLCMRSFFGVLRVEEGSDADFEGTYGVHKLLHGSTLHGTQRDVAIAQMAR